jgi:subtilisin family serine protease
MKRALALLVLSVIVLGSMLPQLVAAQGPGPQRAQPADQPGPVPAAAPDWGGTWQYGTAPAFQFTRFDGGYYPADGLVYVMGGRLPDNNTEGSIWSWDPATDTYTDMGVDMVMPISNYTMNLLQDGSGDWGFYVLCGREYSGTNSFAVQVYYPDTNTPVMLDPADNFPGAIVCSSALNVVYNNTVYVAGGFDGAANQGETWIFDPTAPVGSKWTQIASATLTVPRAYIMGAVVDDMIYAIGGSYFDGAALINVQTVEVLDPNDATPTWNDAAAADLPVQCSESRAWGFDSGSPYADPDGTPLAGKIISGCGFWSAQVPDVYVYDTGLDFWEPFPFFNDARRSQAGELIPDPLELRVWGGYGGEATTEYYSLAMAGACNILLVDDDWDQYSGEPYNGTGTYYYTSTLEALGATYDRWDVWTQGDPALADLQGYDVVVWFTGYAWEGTITPTNETDLATYLDGGGNLFLTAYDYLYDTGGIDAFGAAYLGLAEYVEDTGETDPVGNAGDPVGDGLGPYTLVRPTSWPSGTTGIDYADEVGPLPSASAPFRYQASGENNSTDYAGGAFKTVFLAWPFEGLADIGERTDVMGAALAWLCAPPPGGLQLIPPIQFGGGVPDAAVPYTLTVVNDMGATDTFTLTYDSVWPIVGPDTVGPVDDGMTADFRVTVTVPADASCYETDMAAITAIASDPAFTDTAYIETTADPPGVGDVYGVIYDANTNMGIPDAYVYLELGDHYYEDWADATGAYVLPGVPICVYDGGASAMGYHNNFFTTTSPMTLDLYLDAGWPDLSSDAVSVSILPDSMVTVTVTLANTGTGDLYFHTSELPDDAIYPERMPLGIDAQVYADLDAAPDGTARFLVYMAEQADLTAAFDMADWAARGQYVFDTLRSTAARSQAGLLADLDAADVDYESYYIVNAVAVEGNLTLAQNIAARPDVAYVGPNLEIPAPEPVEMTPAVDGPDAPVWNVAQINADDVWSTFGVTGTGIVVSNIDTGVLYTHTALVDGYRGNMGGGVFDHNYNWWDPYGDMPDYPYDWHSHGSHTIGTMAGGDYGGQEIGVAPGAQWIACNGFDHGGSGYTAELLECAEFILAPWDLTGANPNPAMRPHVVNNSWGGGQAQWWYNQAIYAWRAAGILPTFSNGNSGPGCGTAGDPGDMPNVIAAGATNNADVIADFSSRGPAAVSGILKPNISAPGVNVLSAYNDGTIGGMSGTSMASPHVAGLAALIWSAQPELIGNVALTYEVIEQTAMGITTSQGCGGDLPTDIPNNVYGWGRIDAFEAVSLALSADWDIPWLTVDPVQGTVAPGGNENIALTLDSTGLMTDTCYTGTLMVEFNDPYVQQVMLPLELCVVECEDVSGVDYVWSPTTPTVGLMALFTATVGSGTPPMTYTWDFGDGTGPVVTPDPTAIHAFTAAGTYTVTLMVENACSQADVSYVLTVEAAPPIGYKIYLPIVTRDF